MPRRKGLGRGCGGKNKRTNDAYQLTAPLSEGTILTDILKDEWRIGRPVGQGGFGVLYLASPKVSPSKDQEYVIKIEPHDNGPLFCECHFYQRAAKKDMIQQWLSSGEKKWIGIPRFNRIGHHEVDGEKNRFIVMERFGTDLQKIFEENGRYFPRKAVLQLAIRMLDTLEYIHSHDYVHADIKASNLLLGRNKEDEVYLVDYGLAHRYKEPDGSHQSYREDLRKAHDGTVEFTSRDAHRGVDPSRRGDLEILGYCLLQWLCGKLPWENNVNNKNHVKNLKEQYMNDIPSLMKECFPNGDTPDEVKAYLEYVSNMSYEENPDYDELRHIFQTALRSLGQEDDTLILTAMSSPDKSNPSKWSSIGTTVESPPAKKTEELVLCTRKSPRRAAISDKVSAAAPIHESSMESASPMELRSLGQEDNTLILTATSSPDKSNPRKRSSIGTPVKSPPAKKTKELVLCTRKSPRRAAISDKVSAAAPTHESSKQSASPMKLRSGKLIG